MTAPGLSPAEQATVDRFDAAEAAPESWRPECTLRACRTCTGCAHSGHAACRKTVTCPTDGVTRPCSCCGVAR